MLMTKEEILDFLREHKTEMKERFGVVKIALFGNYIRGEQQEESDIDIAVEIAKDHIAENYFGALHFLQENLRREIDLGIISTIRHKILPYVLKEIHYV
jgi:uncharacterized protein